MSNTAKSRRTTPKGTSTRSKELGKGGMDATTSEATPMIYIYTRVSTTKQTVDNQTHALLEVYKSATLVEETAGGTKARPKLAELIGRLQPFDTLIVYSLDRLGRSTRDVLSIIEGLIDRRVRVIFHKENMTYHKPADKLMLQMMAAFAEFERNLISERTKTGLQARKAQGVKLGAPKHHPDAKRLKALAMLAAGKSIRIVAKLLGVSKSTVQVWQAKDKP